MACQTQHSFFCLRQYLYSPEEMPFKEERDAVPLSSFSSPKEHLSFLRLFSFSKKKIEKSEADLRSLNVEQIQSFSGLSLKELGDRLLLIRPDVLVALSLSQWQALSDHQRSLVNLRRFNFLGSMIQRLPLEEVIAQFSLWSDADILHLQEENFALYQLCLQKIGEFLTRKKLSYIDHRLFEEVPAVKFGSFWYGLGVYHLKKRECRTEIKQALANERQLHFLISKNQAGSFERLLSALPSEEKLEFLLSLPSKKVQEMALHQPFLFLCAQKRLSTLLSEKLPLHWQESSFISNS